MRAGRLKGAEACGCGRCGRRGVSVDGVECVKGERRFIRCACVSQINGGGL